MTIDGRTLLAEVQENRRRVDGGPRHRFEPIKVKLGQRVRCGECGGEMRLPELGSYIAGYEAAGGNADDIWPGYRLKEPRP